MAHGGEQPRRPRHFAGRCLRAEQAVEQGFRLRGDGVEAGGEIAIGVGVHGVVFSRSGRSRKARTAAACGLAAGFG